MAYDLFRLHLHNIVLFLIPLFVAFFIVIAFIFISPFYVTQLANLGFFSFRVVFSKVQIVQWSKTIWRGHHVHDFVFKVLWLCHNQT